MNRVRADRALAGLLVGAAWLALAVAPAGAQQARFMGSVQWISARDMQVMTESGASIAVDLTQAEQSDYRGLRPGDWVFVEGVMSPDRRKVVAREIWRDSGRGTWTQSP